MTSRPAIPGVDEVQNDFSEAADLVALALKQEKDVTDEIIKLAKIARDEDDYKGEQFMQWFLKEQVEEVAQMTTLLNVVRRANGNLFDVENYLARESVGDTATTRSPRARPAASCSGTTRAGPVRRGDRPASVHSANAQSLLTSMSIRTTGLAAGHGS